MKKILSLILLSVMLVLSGCGKSVSEQSEPVIEDQQDDSAEYQLVLDYGFESKKTSYVEGDNVKVYFSIIATDTDYTFYTDSDDVELKQDYDDKKGYVITFIMPDHDVALHVDSVNSMEYADNKYGYTLISVESITEFDVWKIREILAAKYNCSEPPFFTVFDHIDEDGMYVYHIYELVDGETESHTATIDWVYVDPATGVATTFFDEEFNIEDFEY